MRTAQTTRTRTVSPDRTETISQYLNLTSSDLSSGVSLDARSRALVPPPVSSRSPMPPTALPSTASEVSGLDTTLNISSQFNVLDAAECSRRRCSGNGRCENNRCVCSLAYRGDSCQDHVLKMVQGPVVYGVAALCAGMLLVVVAVVVAVKRRTSSRLVSTHHLMFTQPCFTNHTSVCNDQNWSTVPEGGDKVYTDKDNRGAWSQVNKNLFLRCSCLQRPPEDWWCFCVPLRCGRLF